VSFDDTHFLSLGGSSRSIKPGDDIGGYTLKSLLGQGGMGYVFLAEHKIIKRDYALKIIRPDKLDDFSWQRFEIEGRVIAKLDHPNIVKIYDMGIDRDTPYYVMDLLLGQPLSEYINRGEGLTFEQCLDIFCQVAHGLAYAHKKGIVHRDVKPGNFVMLKDNDSFQAKIVDFGLAKVVDAGSRLQAITAKGQVFGSPYYMSPEQCQGEGVDHRSDIYSLGCALYESIAGEPPFVGANAVQTLMMHTDAAMPKLADKFSEEPAIAVDSLIAKMTAKNPHDRYQSMAEVAAALERLQKRAPLLSLSNSARGEHGSDFSSDSSTGIASGQSTTKAARADAKWLLVGSLCVALAVLAVAAFACKDILLPKPKVVSMPPEAVSLLNFGPIKSHSTGVAEARVFEFPEYQIGYVVPLDHRQSLKASGSVRVRSRNFLALSVDEFESPIVFKYPQVFEQIGKDEFYGLELKARGSLVTIKDNKTYNKEFNFDGLGRTAQVENSQKQLLEILKIVSSWSRLTAMNLDGFNENEAVFNLIDQLPHLKMLVLKRSDFSIKEFAKHKILARLNYLRVQDPLESFVDPIIYKLVGSANLIDLQLDDVEFTSAAFLELKHCPNLKSLGLNKLDISDDVIKAMGQFKSLKFLSSDGTKLSDRQLESLAKMKNLTVTLEACDYDGEGPGRDHALLKAYRTKFPTIIFH
jgi:serine/threonine protein kinase